MAKSMAIILLLGIPANKLFEKLKLPGLLGIMAALLKTYLNILFIRTKLE